MTEGRRNEPQPEQQADTRGPLDLDSEIEKLRANAPVRDALSPETPPQVTSSVEASAGLPAHPGDPSPQNPAPVGHPLHQAWIDATRAAELELMRFNYRLEGTRSDVLRDIEKMVPVLQKELLRGNSEPFTSFKAKCDQWWEYWHILYFVGAFHIWAERALVVVWNYESARYHENWLKSYSNAMEAAAKTVPEADENLDPVSFLDKLRYHLSRECAYGSLRAYEIAAAIQGRSAPPSQQKSKEGSDQSPRQPTDSTLIPDSDAASPFEPASPKDGASRENAPPAAEKRNIRILRGLDGRLKKAVPVDVASRFGGVSRRAIEKAVKKGTIQAEGDRQNRRILVQSLLKYFPPEDNAN